MDRRPLTVEAQRLTKRYGEFVAVDGLDLDVKAGSVVSLLGPNGAGKTTTVRMLATLVAPTSGWVRVCGYDTVRDGDAVRELISLTGQFAALDGNLTATENLVLLARLRGHGKRAAARIVAALIDRFDIGEVRDKYVKQVSGGQRRRIDLAASLVTQPRLLVLDEPTTGLDPRSRQVVWATVRELASLGVTLLLTAQYLEEADALADRIVLIDRGREIASGTPTELKSRIGQQRVDVVAGDNDSFERLAAMLGELFACTLSPARRLISIEAPGESAELTRVAAAVQDAGIPTTEISLRRPTLDDAFLALTGLPAPPKEVAA